MTVTTDEARGETVIALCGELDLDARPVLHRTAAALRAGTAVRLDLTGVPFMDASGLHFLLDVRRRLHRPSDRLSLTGVQQQPARLLLLSQVLGLLPTPFIPHQEDACRGGSRPQAAERRSPAGSGGTG